jgi:hypothetical protein
MRSFLCPALAILLVSTEAYAADVEMLLDKAQEELAAAGAYTCQRDGAKEALDQVQKRFDNVAADAKRFLGRELDVRVWTNSCRKEGDGSRFRSLVRAADQRVQQAERALKLEAEAVAR